MSRQEQLPFLPCNPRNRDFAEFAPPGRRLGIGRLVHQEWCFWLKQQWAAGSVHNEDMLMQPEELRTELGRVLPWNPTRLLMTSPNIKARRSEAMQTVAASMLMRALHPPDGIIDTTQPGEASTMFLDLVPREIDGRLIRRRPQYYGTPGHIEGAFPQGLQSDQWYGNDRLYVYSELPAKPPRDVIELFLDEDDAASFANLVKLTPYLARLGGGIVEMPETG